MPKGQCKFDKKFVTDSKYKLWLVSVDDIYKGKCRLCNKEFCVKAGCESAIISHAKGKTHIKLVEEKKSASKSLASLFFMPGPSTSSNVPTSSAVPVSSNASKSPKTSQRILDDVAEQALQALHAEIRWAMKSVRSHFSFRSCDGLKELFHAMFPDSTIASDFAMARQKCSYVVKFGIAPYFRYLLTSEINQSPFFSVSFDEAYNRSLQKNQMDIVLRYWCPVSNEVKVRYWDSTFQYGATADILLAALNEGLKSLDSEKRIQLSMDGPHVNWLILKNLQTQREEEGNSPLEDIGSCGLHVVSGAFQNGVQAANWNLEKVLRGMWKLLDKSSARRGDFLKVCTVSPPSFPLKFCTTRWVENESVSVRAISLWPSIVQMMKEYLLKPPSKRPKNNASYDNLIAAHTDLLMLVKLHVFSDISAMLHSFLKNFQSNNPMVPFLADALERIVRQMMKFFLLKKSVNAATTQFQLMKLDVEDAAKHKPISSVKLTTSAEAVLASGNFTTEQKESIRKGFVSMTKKIVLKMQERCPLKFLITRLSSSLSPHNMADDGEASSSKFHKLVNLLHQHKRFTGKGADAAKEQYDMFLDKDVKINLNKFRKFDMKKDRLDEFLGTYMIGVPKYENLWKVCIFIFVLSHGQAPVERGFNINKSTAVENLQEDSLVALRLVYDEIIVRGDDIAGMAITPELAISCHNARQKYDTYLKNNTDEAAKSLVGQKRKLLQDEYAEVKRKKTEEEEIVTTLQGSIDKFISLAAVKVDPLESKKLVVQANSFQVTIKEKKSTISQLESALNNLQNDIKNCK